MSSKSSRFEKRIYVAHPFRNDPKNVAEIGKQIKAWMEMDDYKNYLFVSPVHSFGYLYTAVRYEQGMEYDFELLDMCDEVWMFGAWPGSAGCLLELSYACAHNIPVHILSESNSLNFVLETLGINKGAMINDASYID